MVLSDSKKMKAADSEAIHGRGIPSLQLMETAAGHVAKAASALAGDRHSAVVFCGPGNNGGDGVAAARMLMDMGFAVRAYLVGVRDKMTEDTHAMERELQSAGGQLEDFHADDERLPGLLRDAGVVVDAMFGVGLSRPLAGDALAAVQMINAANRPVAAADIPSGVSADTGAVLGDAVKADCTVTFSMAKPGHYIEPGCVYRGELVVADIGIPEDILSGAGCGLYAIHKGDLALPGRKPLSHKGDYGKVLILAGSKTYTGAPSLCAHAAVRAGAGLVYLGVPADIYEIEAVKNDEAMVFPLPSNGQGQLDEAALPDILERLEACDVCVIGPGLGRSGDTAAVVSGVLKSAKCPVVADADALWAIAGDLELLQTTQAPLVLTPHEGEFARLLGRPVKDRLTDALDFSKTYDCALVLKGHRTICAFPDGKGYVIDAGNPGMAKGGSGDVLAGVIGAMLGQLTARRAVVTACWLHSRAGDLCEQAMGEYAVKAGDIIEMLYRAQQEIIR